MILRIIFMVCMISNAGQVYAAMHNASIALANKQKKAVRTNSMAQVVFSNEEVNQAFKKLFREISYECYFCHYKLEKAICATCCGSSKIIKKDKVNVYEIRHYSCCCAYRAMHLVTEDSKAFVSKYKKAESSFTVDRQFQLPAVCCCIQQAQETITWSNTLILPPPAKPTAPDAKRD